MEKANDQQLSFQCFGYRSTNGGKEGYYAACVELGVVTFRPTLEEAKDSLSDAIQGYVESAANFAENEEEFRELILRPLPFWPWGVRYLFISLLVKIQKKSKNSSDVLFNRFVDIPVPA